MRVTAAFSEEQVLTIYLEGDIRSNNAQDVEEQIMSHYKAHKAKALILDVQKLRIITSGGLRVLLKLIKMEPNIRLINASLEVYEILDMTGFTQMLPISRALRSIDVSAGTVLGGGFQGKVLRLDEETIVKLYHPGQFISDIERERDYAKKAFVMGIPSAIPFDIVRCGEQYGLVFELIDADTLANHLSGHPEEIPEYAVKYTETLRQLHKIRAGKGMFNKIKESYSRRIEGLREFLAPREVATLQIINSCMPEADTLIHGDYHPKNVMVQQGELVIIDMADLACGHPLYELGSMSMVHYHPLNPNNTERFMGMKPEHLHKLWDLFLEDYLGTDDPAVIDLVKYKANAVAMLRIAANGAFLVKTVGWDFYEPQLELIRRELIAKADELIPLLSAGLF